MAGGSFPGIPAVLTGHNEKIAWGVTVVYYDLSDVYLEELSDDGKSVKFMGKEVPIIEKEVSFYVAAKKASVTRTLRWVPHHGPIVSEDPAKKQATSVRWVAHDGTTDLQAFMKLDRAGSVAEAREALRDVTSANQNFVVADTAGDIGWFPYGKVPSRPWASPGLPPWLPLPGDGSAEWQGYVAIEELPQLLNPPRGFVATANQDATGAGEDGDPTNDGHPFLQAWSKAEGTRERRIVDLLEAGGDAHTLETMRAIQLDTHLLVGETLAPIFAEAKGLDPSAQAVADAIASWKYTCPTGLDGADPKKAGKASDPAIAAESIGCTAFHVALYALVGAALSDEITAAGGAVGVGLGSRATFLMRSVLKPDTLLAGQAFWDDVATPDTKETRADIAAVALAAAAKALSPLGEPDDWRWGKVHTLVLESVFANFGLNGFNAGPFAAPGGLLSVNVASPSSPSTTTPLDLHFSEGPSLRSLIEIGPKGPRMKFQFPGGSDLHRESAFYNNLVPAWLKGEPVDFAFGPDELPQGKNQLEVSPAD
jgi:penicillin G amidase